MKAMVMMVAGMLAIASPALAQAPAADAAPAKAEAAVPKRGMLLVDAKGVRLAPVSRIAPNGAVEIVFEGAVVRVPAETLSIVNGKLTTSLKRNEVMALR